MTTNSGALRSKFPTSYSKKSKAKMTHLFKGSNGRTRIVSQQKSENVANNRLTAAQQILQDEKDRVAKERQEKARLVKAIANKPSDAKLKQDKDGRYYYQTRNNKGHFNPKTYLA